MMRSSISARNFKLFAANEFLDQCCCRPNLKIAMRLLRTWLPARLARLLTRRTDGWKIRTRKLTVM